MTAVITKSIQNLFGGCDKNWTYDLFDVNEAFYHWTTHPKKLCFFPNKNYIKIVKIFILVDLFQI